jgi:ParB-like chromosome segregation protein Spo0J
MKERFARIEALGMTTAELAGRLGTTEVKLAEWIMGRLTLELEDEMEVALALLESRRSYFDSLRVTAATTLAGVVDAIAAH